MTRPTSPTEKAQFRCAELKDVPIVRPAKFIPRKETAYNLLLDVNGKTPAKHSQQNRHVFSQNPNSSDGRAARILCPLHVLTVHNLYRHIVNSSIMDVL